MPDLGIRLEDRPDGTWIIKDMSADEQQEVSAPPFIDQVVRLNEGALPESDGEMWCLQVNTIPAARWPPTVVLRVWRARQPSCVSVDVWKHERKLVYVWIFLAQAYLRRHTRPEHAA